MSRGAVKIVPMRRAHVSACDKIVAASEPWKRLNERIDFPRILSQERPLVRAYVCTEGREPLGFVLFTPEPVFARGGYLRAIGVSPAMRRRGIGKKLLSFAEKAVSGKSPILYLCVSSFNRRAQAFYRRMGYSRVGKLPGLIHPGAAEYIYWKWLKRS